MNCARCQRAVDSDEREHKAYFVTVAETRLKYGREFFERIICGVCAAAVWEFLCIPLDRRPG